jgi:hypothetical protein
MRDDDKTVLLDAGLSAREEPMPRITSIEIIAGILTLAWLILALVYGRGDAAGEGGIAQWLVDVVFLAMPVALISVAARTARAMHALRLEAARLQSEIDAMRAKQLAQAPQDSIEIKPAMVAKLDALVQSRIVAAQGEQAVFASQRAHPQIAARAPIATPVSEAPQPGLAFAAPVERPPISMADFIQALNFPQDEHDKEGFRTLRRALEDRASERLVRASQDVLTLLSQDGIYMDDLAPDHARPEVWRRFAQGERGRAVAALGGVHDRSSLALAAGRIKTDPVFRDAVHHFLRHFDRTFMAFERNATDADIVALANTRTARAFMLLGRAAGTFD